MMTTLRGPARRSAFGRSDKRRLRDWAPSSVPKTRTSQSSTSGAMRTVRKSSPATIRARADRCCSSIRCPLGLSLWKSMPTYVERGEWQRKPSATCAVIKLTSQICDGVSRPCDAACTQSSTGSSRCRRVLFDDRVRLSSEQAVSTLLSAALLGETGAAAILRARASSVLAARVALAVEPVGEGGSTDASPVPIISPRLGRG